jgi:hypothetical protein
MCLLVLVTSGIGHIFKMGEHVAFMSLADTVCFSFALHLLGHNMTSVRVMHCCGGICCVTTLSGMF